MSACRCPAPCESDPCPLPATPSLSLPLPRRRRTPTLAPVPVGCLSRRHPRFHLMLTCEGSLCCLQNTARPSASSGRKGGGEGAEGGGRKLALGRERATAESKQRRGSVNIVIPPKTGCRRHPCGHRHRRSMRFTCGARAPAANAEHAMKGSSGYCEYYHDEISNSTSEMKGGVGGDSESSSKVQARKGARQANRRNKM